jgi:AAA15 family ATPase/GTPase
MQPKIWIDQIEFSDGSVITCNKNEIIVFVGPNNAGKSATLKEASNLLKSKNLKGKVIKTISFSKEGTISDLTTFIETISIKEFTTNEKPWYKGFEYRIYEGDFNSWWNNLSNGVGDLSKVFAKYLTTEERLKAANPANNIKLISEPAKHPINFLQKSDTLEKKFSDYFKQAFGLDLIVHRNAGSEVPLFVGIAPTIQPGQDRISESYQIELEKLDLLHEQGDGMRSFVGVLLNAFVAYHSILFIDEPEAFLHPPQARLLGKMLANDLPSDRQLLLATHNTDFLKGLLEANTSNLKVVRIQREGNINKVSVLNNSDINAIWNDSLLRHSNILDGLFHSQVVICESDSDNRFYSAILSSIHEGRGTLSPDTLFINCGGKHRISTVVKALKQLNVIIKVIADFDLLNDTNPLREIYQETGGNWNEIEGDWRIVKSAIESKRPELETKELKEEIDQIFLTTPDKIFPKSKISPIQKALKKASAWSHAKEVGKSFIPSGDATKAFERLQSKLKEKGIFIVEVGELESFAKSVGNHGPKWVNDVLTKDLINDPELSEARRFISEVTN